MLYATMCNKYSMMYNNVADRELLGEKLILCHIFVVNHL